MAGPLVTECPLDENEVWRIVPRNDLSGGGDAHKEATPGSEQLFGDQYSERRADRTADDAEFDTIEREPIEIGVISRPRRILLGASGRNEMPNEIAVRIEDTHFGDFGVRKVLLLTSLSEERTRGEYGRVVESLGLEKR